MNESDRLVEFAAAPGDPDSANGTNVTISLARELLIVLDDGVTYGGASWVKTTGDHDAPIFLINSSSRGLADSLINVTVTLVSGTTSVPAELLSYLNCLGPPLCGRSDFPPGYVRQLGYYPSWKAAMWVNLTSQSGVGSVSSLVYQDTGQGDVILTFATWGRAVENQSLSFTISVNRSAATNSSTDNRVGGSVSVDSHAPRNGTLGYGLDTIDWFQAIAPGGPWRVDASFSGRVVTGGRLQMAAELMVWNSTLVPIAAVNSQTAGVSCGGCIVGATSMSLPIPSSVSAGEILFFSLFVLPNDLFSPAPWALNGTLSYSLTFQLPNRPPATITDDLVVSTDEDDTVTVDLGDYYTDSDGDVLSFQVTPGDANLSVAWALQDRYLSFIPASDASGEAKFTILASDGYVGWSAPLNITLVVRATNDAPRLNLTDLPAVVVWDQGNDSGDIHVGAFLYDPEGDPVSLILRNPGLISMSYCGMGCIRFAGSTPDVYGSFSANVTASDVWGVNISFFINLTIRHVNRPPIPNPAAPTTVSVIATIAGTRLAVEDFCSDPDGDNLTLAYDPTSEAGTRIVATPADNGSGGTDLTLTAPAINDAGSWNAILICADGPGLTARTTVTIVVSAPNRPPILMTSVPEPTFPLVLAENTTHDFHVAATDPDGDTLSYTWSLGGIVLSGALTNTTSIYLDFDSSGEHQLEVVILDTFGLSTRVVWDVTITNVDRPPVCEITPIDGVNGTVGSVVELESTSYDPDGTTIIHRWFAYGTLVSKTQEATITLQEGERPVELRVTSAGLTETCSIILYADVSSPPPNDGNSTGNENDGGFLPIAGLAAGVLALTIAAIAVSVVSRRRR
jgi:hypothetical protein